MNWNKITKESDIQHIKAVSFKKIALIFKHSTNCSISSIAKVRLEDSWNFDNIEIFLLDLILYRNLSNQIAENFDVYHQSPQIILIKDGQSFHDASHFDISVAEIEDVL